MIRQTRRRLTALFLVITTLLAQAATAQDWDGSLMASRVMRGHFPFHKLHAGAAATPAATAPAQRAEKAEAADEVNGFVVEPIRGASEVRQVREPEITIPAQT